MTLPPSRRTAGLRQRLAILLLAASSLGGILAAPAPVAAQRAIDPAQKAQIEAVVRQYILEHPEIVVEALQAMQMRREAEAVQRQQQALESSREALVSAKGDPVGGNPQGDVTLVEFFDYQCGYCKAVHPSLRDLMGEDRNLRVVYKEFPILGPASVTAAKAALAAARQGKYEPMHDALMELRGQLDDAKVMRVAESLDLDLERLKADMESVEILATIERNMDLARRLEINGTPAFVIGDQLVPGAVPLEQLKEAVGKARAG
jgi:protein-disulfide isomerase